MNSGFHQAPLNGFAKDGHVLGIHNKPAKFLNNRKIEIGQENA